MHKVISVATIDIADRHTGFNGSPYDPSRRGLVDWWIKQDTDRLIKEKLLEFKQRKPQS